MSVLKGYKGKSHRELLENVMPRFTSCAQAEAFLAGDESSAIYPYETVMDENGDWICRPNPAYEAAPFAYKFVDQNGQS